MKGLKRATDNFNQREGDTIYNSFKFFLYLVELDKKEKKRVLSVEDIIGIA